MEGGQGIRKDGRENLVRAPSTQPRPCSEIKNTAPPTSQMGRLRHKWLTCFLKVPHSGILTQVRDTEPLGVVAGFLFAAGSGICVHRNERDMK